MRGILPIDKPKGITSHDAVARVRRLSGQRRIGHAGTLDPLATGVLILCLGDATRLVDRLMDGTKWYLARVAFGMATETDDAEGQIVGGSEPRFGEATLLGVLAGQVGDLAQVPPQFAAIKQAGIPAYQEARAGRRVELAARPISIHALTLLSLAPLTLPTPGQVDAGSHELLCADLLICCGKGTYVRSLARDLGEALGCGAYLAGLRRLASGGITSAACVTLADLEEAVLSDGQAAVESRLLPPDAALEDVAAAILSPLAAAAVGHGMPVSLPVRGVESLRLYDEAGALLGLAAPANAADPKAGRWQPRLVFAPGGR